MNGHDRTELFYGDLISQNYRTVPPTRGAWGPSPRPQSAPPPIPSPGSAGDRNARPAFGNGPPSQFAPGRAISVAGGGLRPLPDPPQSAVEGLIRTTPTLLSSAGSNRIDLRSRRGTFGRHLPQPTAR